MTTQDWISVAMIIAVIITAAATAAGPVLAVIVQVRMSQPRPTPTTSQPDDEAQTKARRRPWYRSPWMLLIPLLGVVSSSLLLVIEFVIFTPVTRWFVLRIAFATASIAYHLTTAMFLMLIQVITETKSETPN